MAQINYLTKLDYSNAITANLLNIEYDEVLYKSLPRESNNFGQIYYGSEPGSLTSGAVHRYPFSLVVEDPQKEGIYLWQERDKSFSISASIPSTETVTTTPCFDKARGYECKEETTLLTDESVTTVTDGRFARSTLAYSTPIDANTIKVTFNGTEYVCDSHEDKGILAYGAPMGDFSEYPFSLASVEGANMLITENAGTYRVKIEALEETIETSECFKKAVESVMPAIPTPSVLQLIPGVTTEAEVEQANANGTLMYVQNGVNPSSRMYAFVQSYFNGGFSTIPDQNTLGWLVEIQNGVVALALVVG